MCMYKKTVPKMYFCIYAFCSMDGGELFSRIQDRGDQAFTERGNMLLLTSFLALATAALYFIIT